MKLELAQLQAGKLVAALKPYAIRIEVAGSVRREKPDVKDIEIVMIPDARKLMDLAVLIKQWGPAKGNVGGKYAAIPYTPVSDIGLDLFFATPRNWGLIFAIRTGSADFSHYVLAGGWVKKGFHSSDGILVREAMNKLSGEQVAPREILEFHEEEALFRWLSLRWPFPPKEREL